MVTCRLSRSTYKIFTSARSRARALALALTDPPYQKSQAGSALLPPVNTSIEHRRGRVSKCGRETAPPGSGQWGRTQTRVDAAGNEPTSPLRPGSRVERVNKDQGRRCAVTVACALVLSYYASVDSRLSRYKLQGLPSGAVLYSGQRKMNCCGTCGAPRKAGTPGVN